MSLKARLGAIFIVLIAATAAVAALPVGRATESESIGDSTHLVMMLIYAAVALVFSFLCSVAEAVLLSVTPSFIARLENERERSGRLLRKVKSNIDRSLAAILTLNTIAHTIGAAGAGAEAAAYFEEKYVGVAMVILTLLILFLSEIIPKTIGAVYWRHLAVWTGRFVQLMIWCLYPLILVSELLTKLITRGKPVHVFSRDEFAALAEIGEQHGHIDPKESRILKNLFRFPDLRATDIMTPRTVVFALQQDLSVGEVMEQHPEIAFSRIPIYDENVDDMKGFVLKTDLLLDEANQDGRSKLRDFVRDIRAVPAPMPLTQVLEAMLDERNHILLVLDEYGGLEGIVTLEDVVETLIGAEIVDEADRDVNMRAVAMKKREERMKRMGIELSEPDVEEP